MYLKLLITCVELLHSNVAFMDVTQIPGCQILQEVTSLRFFFNYEFYRTITEPIVNVEANVFNFCPCECNSGEPPGTKFGLRHQV